MGIKEIKTPHGNGYMHDGFWGTATIHFPDYDTSIAVHYVDNYNLNSMKEAFIKIVELSKKQVKYLSNKPFTIKKNDIK